LVISKYYPWKIIKGIGWLNGKKFSTNPLKSFKFFIDHDGEYGRISYR